MIWYPIIILGIIFCFYSYRKKKNLTRLSKSDVNDFHRFAGAELGLVVFSILALLPVLLMFVTKSQGSASTSDEQIAYEIKVRKVLAITLYNSIRERQQTTRKILIIMPKKEGISKQYQDSFIESLKETSGGADIKIEYLVPDEIATENYLHVTNDKLDALVNRGAGSDAIICMVNIPHDFAQSKTAELSSKEKIL
ncbi:MAG: hypothetical protein HRT89_13825, partial [Lentisphaeria bacterium]|nr:hypothetical protein [Lentisphaeria bacterium]